MADIGKGTSDLRQHEVAVDLPPPDDAHIRFIGRIHTPVATARGLPTAWRHEWARMQN